MKATLPAFLTVLILSSGAALAQDPHQTLVLNRCGACHNTTRICKNLGVKDGAAWEKTVATMVGKGAKLAPSEQQAVAAYLTTLPAGSKPVCQ